VGHVIYALNNEGEHAMTAMTFEEFQNSSETVRGVRKTLGAVLALAPEDAAVPGPLTTDGIKINALPADYVPVGLLTPEGINFEREVNTETVEALGHFSPVREDITGGARRLSFTALEVLNRRVVEVSEAIDLSTATVDPATGEVSYEIPDQPNQVFYRAIVLGYDGSTVAPWFDGRFFPRVSVTSFPSETWSKTDPRTAEIGLTAYLDDELGYIEKRTHAGAGFAGQAENLGWTVGA